MYTLKYSLKKKCRHCKNPFIANRISNIFCSKDCASAHHQAAKKVKKKSQQRARVKRQALIKIEERKSRSDAFWANPDIIRGHDAISDYLKIGKEELRQRWLTIPYRYKEHVEFDGKKYHASKKRVYVLRTELDRWAQDIGYWQFKETVVKNYKEPLKAVPEGNGFGYFGAVTTTRDGDGIQCHICGKFYMHLSGHINYAHHINVAEYKKQFDLAYSTPLTADNYREVLKLKEIERVRNMTPEQREAYKMSLRNRAKPFGGHGLKLRLETKNKRGTCPDQLIDQIRRCGESIGRTPSKKDFIAWTKTQRYVHKIYDTFGSWTKAVEIAGFTPVPLYHPTEEEKRPYDEEELLEYLKVFYEETGKSPTATDWNSHDLPAYSTYIKRFGGIKQARELAGVPHPEPNRQGQHYHT